MYRGLAIGVASPGAQFPNRSGFIVGLFCVWWSFWPRDEPSAASASAGPRKAGLVSRLSDELAQAGYVAVTPGNLLGACFTAFFLVFVGATATTRVVPIALCFALMAAYAPIRQLNVIR